MTKVLYPISATTPPKESGYYLVTYNAEMFDCKFETAYFNGVKFTSFDSRKIIYWYTDKMPPDLEKVLHYIRTQIGEFNRGEIGYIHLDEKQAETLLTILTGE